MRKRKRKHTPIEREAQPTTSTTNAGGGEVRFARPAHFARGGPDVGPGTGNKTACERDTSGVHEKTESVEATTCDDCLAYLERRENRGARLRLEADLKLCQEGLAAARKTNAELLAEKRVACARRDLAEAQLAFERLTGPKIDAEALMKQMGITLDMRVAKDAVERVRAEQAVEKASKP